MVTAEAQPYFDERLNSEAWDDATEADQNKALTMATRQIDQLNYAGDMTEDDQDNQFPRGGDTVVPNDILIACCEIAIAFLDLADSQDDYDDLFVSQDTYGNVKSSYTSGVAPLNVAAGIPSIIAWRLLTPYFRGADSIIMSKV